MEKIIKLVEDVIVRGESMEHNLNVNIELVLEKMLDYWIDSVGQGEYLGGFRDFIVDGCYAWMGEITINDMDIDFEEIEIESIDVDALFTYLDY